MLSLSVPVQVLPLTSNPNVYIITHTRSQGSCSPLACREAYREPDKLNWLANPFVRVPRIFPEDASSRVKILCCGHELGTLTKWKTFEVRSSKRFSFISIHKISVFRSEINIAVFVSEQMLFSLNLPVCFKLYYYHSENKCKNLCIFLYSIE